MVTKEILGQYSDLLEEIKEVKDEVLKLEYAICEIEEKIREIEAGETVVDKVNGGMGGIQSFVIEGVPVPEYRKKKNDLQSKKLLLEKRKQTLERQNMELLDMTNKVEVFVASISDSCLRRIIRLKFINKLSWYQVAKKIGGGNTESGVKSKFHRFMEKN